MIFISINNRQLTAQSQVDTLLLVLQEPNCSAKIADSIECAQLTRSLIRDLSAFYEPILNHPDQQRWVQLYLKKTLGSRLPNNLNTNPAAEMLVRFDLTPQAVEVRVMNILTGENIAEVEEPLISAKPADLRKSVSAAADETTRQIMRNVYNQQLGTKYQLRVKTPPIKNFRLAQSPPAKGRWQTLPLTREGVYSTFSALQGDAPATVTAADVISGQTYADWLIRAKSDEQGVIAYRMHAYRLFLDLSGGLALPATEAVGWGSGALSFLVGHNLSLRAGAMYHVLPMETQVEPRSGQLAVARNWLDDTVVPFLGLGYQRRELALGIRYGITLDGGPAPRYLRGSGWLSLDKWPAIRLHAAYQTLIIDVEQRAFSRTAAAAPFSSQERTFGFLAFGMGWYQPIR